MGELAWALLGRRGGKRVTVVLPSLEVFMLQILKARISHNQAKINAEASARQEQAGAGGGEDLSGAGWLPLGRRLHC